MGRCGDGGVCARAVRGVVGGMCAGARDLPAEVLVPWAGISTVLVTLPGNRAPAADGLATGVHPPDSIKAKVVSGLSAVRMLLKSASLRGMAAPVLLA